MAEKTLERRRVEALEKIAAALEVMKHPQMLMKHDPSRQGPGRGTKEEWEALLNRLPAEITFRPFGIEVYGPESIVARRGTHQEGFSRRFIGPGALDEALDWLKQP